jgi:uncharacterized lipoprotein YajG
MKSSNFKTATTLLAALFVAAGCAGISDNTMNASQATASVDQADLKASTEVVTTVFSGTREKIDIIVIRPDL